MKNLFKTSGITLLNIVIFSTFSFSQTLVNEISGIDNSKPSINPENSQRTMDAIPTGGLLLIPESTNDRVMAFDPTTGNLVDADFIPADPTNLSTPIQAILNHDGSGILVSDQLDDVVQEYDLDGNYVGVFAPATGKDISILDNIRGICLRPNGNLLVTVGSGTNADNIAEFDTDGNSLGNFMTANGDSPFDVIRLADNSFLVGYITTDNILKYDDAGTYTGLFTDINSFPEQLYETSTGNILVGNYSGTEEGVVEYSSTGILVDIYDPPSLGGYRGAYELPNGNILTTNGSGVYEIDRSGNLVDTKISSVSARFITYVSNTPTTPISPFVIPLNILVIVIFILIRYRKLAHF